MTTQNVPIQPSDDAPQEPLGDRLIWLLKGFAWPCFSRPYYVESTRRKLMVGILFLALFSVLQTLVGGTQLAINLRRTQTQVAEDYGQSGFPVITIRDGVARATPSEPFAISQQGTLLAIDTTGETTQIDQTQYSQGFLLTRTDLHVLSNGRYQTMPLDTFHEMLGNPIVINRETVTAAWGKLLRLIIPLGFIAIYCYSLFVRLLYFVIVGVIVWGIVSIKHKGYEFAKVVMVGIYAGVPTWYIHFLLGLMGADFCLSYTLIIAVIWGIAMAFVLQQETGDTPQAQPVPSIATMDVPKVFELPHEVLPPAPPDDQEPPTGDAE